MKTIRFPHYNPPHPSYIGQPIINIKKLKELMIQKRFRAADLIRNLPIHHSMINSILTGKTINPSISTIYPIAQRLDTTIDNLIIIYKP